uniref:Uncharacterized protein n=1 Tax=Phlebotomus papatasi TaxID=29031 RepID=A0A1B0D133_PHLPP
MSVVSSLQNPKVKMKMSKLSNQTNSQDPQAVNSRIFVGNLNTFQCSKTDVERMFQRYGRLADERSHPLSIEQGGRNMKPKHVQSGDEV